MEELFNGQLSFADIEAEKFLQIRRTHADRRVNAMDRLTDDVINELIQLCLPLYHPKSRSKRSRYSSENDVLIEKSVKYKDFFLLSIVYV